jgi:hypothetical protein
MNPTTILAELWADGVSITVAPDNANLVAPANRLTPAQREFIKAHKPALIDFLMQARATTDAVIAAAMRRCDQFNDNEAAREQMRQDVLTVPPHQQADLLDHFNGKPVNFD